MRKYKSRLKLIKELDPKICPKGRKTKVGLFLCDCGNEKVIGLSKVKSGHTSSCGCLHKEIVSKTFKNKGTHLLTYHPLYPVWTGMKSRCFNETCAAYKNYGGRGITMCDEWKNSVTCFYNWSIENGWKKGLHIDRINNDGNYEPSNCRFVSRVQNNRNRRTNKFNIETVKEVRASKLTKEELAFKFNCSVSAIKHILNYRTWKDVV